MVYVVSKRGKPLMPTERYAHVRRLLKSHRAVPICNNPFTIRLKYETPEIVQDLYLGIDPGRENIGVGVSKEDGTCVFLGELETCNKSIKKNMNNRRGYRHSRRKNARLRRQRKAIRNNNQFKSSTLNTLKGSKKCVSKEYLHPGFEEPVIHKAIKGKEPRFNNRKRKEGWLSPSARQLIQMHFRVIESAMKFLPVSHIILEKNRFDFQKLENIDIKSWQYSKGILYGYNSYKDYIYEQQNGKCLLCGCNSIDNYHHIVPKSKGGSDTASNIAGLCLNCHHKVHTSLDSERALSAKKSGLKQQYKIGLLNTVMPFLVEELNDFCISKNIDFSLSNGYNTSVLRNALGYSKDHYIDGYVISISNRVIKSSSLTDMVYCYKRFKKKSANNIHKLNRREYYFNAKLVAVNRAKATEQKEDSLKEYKELYLKDHTQQELDLHLKSLIVKPAHRIYTSHREHKTCDIHVGDIVKYEKKNKIKGNTKRLVFVATGINLSQGGVQHGTKSKKLKYCKLLQSGCINVVDAVKLC